MTPHAAFRYYQTLRHLKPWQIGGRLLGALKRKASFGRIPQYPGQYPGTTDTGLCQGTPFLQHDPWNSRENVARGVFKFLGEQRDLGRPANWEAPGAALLWQYNLHYFQYLHLLDREEQASICREWTESNPVGQGVGWRPYPLSLRIVNWCRARVSDVDASLYRQAAYLYRHLETYHPGNHLLENARALVYAGCYFRGAGESDDWLERGLSIYRDETPDQVLADGGYFEWTPMYHALMLGGYLDLINILPDNHRDRTYLSATAEKMTDFLASVTHPDGQLPLFNDATQEIAPSTVALCDYARSVIGYEPSMRDRFDETGLFVVRGEREHLIVDGGKIGPDHLPAHAHADIFSYEFSLDGEQLITDTGVFEYAQGDMRSYVRSTAAHNTICVDDTDQAECWHSFRVARRYDPEDVRFTDANGVAVFEGSFAGYANLIGDGIVHRRKIRLDRSAGLMTVTDRIDGTGRHRVESRIHLHPDVRLAWEGQAATLRKGGAECAFQAAGAEPRVEKGWYCPRFGKRLERDVIVLGGEVNLPVEMEYTLSYQLHKTMSFSCGGE